MTSILDQDIMYLPGVGPKRKEILSKELNIQTWRDLLEYYPYKYVDRSKIYTIDELNGSIPFVQIKGKILSFEEFSNGTRRKRIVAHFSDGHGVVDLVWFRGTQYIYKTYALNTEYIVFGKPTIFGSRYQFAHPEIEKADELQLNEMGMQPYYSTTERMKTNGITSRTIEKLTKNLISRLPKDAISETLPVFIQRPLHLISREAAFKGIHYPKSLDELQHAQVRLKFEELFYVQLNILRYASDHRRKYRGYVFQRVGQIFNTFYQNNLPFDLTNAQKRVMHELRDDMASGKQMNRLLQGDVGSGKTLVALMTMLIAIDNGFQACIMAPTEILAEQHLTTIKEFLQGMDVRVELLTGIVKGKKRQEVLEALANGDINILVGTHAVIEDTVQFARLGLAVVDEQHRFGVAQRARLWAKSENPPHILVMTATPIPRTLAMTIYGDLDVSIIDELPPGRKPIQTIHKFDNQMTSLYNGIRQQIQQGRQVYIVFPLIKENEKNDLKDLEKGYESLLEIFPEFRISKVHGKMKPAEKEEEMRRFVSGETQILVATTVIEVGVNVPNATVMVIMDADRFGLSQLHQLRGRVGRGDKQSYCVLVANPKNDTGKKRMQAMCETTDGFVLAEEDLKMRGSGEIFGTRQSGIPEFQVADIVEDYNILEEARRVASQIVSDPNWRENPDWQVLGAHLRSQGEFD